MTTRAVNDQWNSAEVRQAACFTVPEAQLDCYRISALYGAYVIVDFQYHALVWNWKDNHWAFYRKKGDEVSDSKPASIHTSYELMSMNRLFVGQTGKTSRRSTRAINSPCIRFMACQRTSFISLLQSQLVL